MSRTIVRSTLAAVFLIAALPSLAGSGGRAGAVYVASNAPAGNAILVFDRSADGELNPAGEVPTGGLGTGGGLGNQGGVVMDDSGRRLYVVNAGSDSISTFEIRASGLQRRSVTPSGGSKPVSVAVRGRLLYVVHAGIPNVINGFRIGKGGSLRPISGSTRALSASATGPAQIAFSPDGEALIVTEKMTNRIAVFPVNDGVAGAPTFLPSAGATPFGFAFGKRDQVFVSEAFGGAAGASAVSAYGFDDGALVTLDPSVATRQSAACWVVVSGDGRFAYTTNTASATLSAFQIGFDGRLALLDADGIAARTDAGPIDMQFAANGRLLYVLNSSGNSVTGYRVGADGSLESAGGIGGIPPGANGLAAR